MNMVYRRNPSPRREDPTPPAPDGLSVPPRQVFVSAPASAPEHSVAAADPARRRPALELFRSDPVRPP
jgi:hypothetical protein